MLSCCLDLLMIPCDHSVWIAMHVTQPGMGSALGTGMQLSKTLHHAQAHGTGMHQHCSKALHQGGIWHWHSLVPRLSPALPCMCIITNQNKRGLFLQVQRSSIITCTWVALTSTVRCIMHRVQLAGYHHLNMVNLVPQCANACTMPVVMGHPSLVLRAQLFY